MGFDGISWRCYGILWDLMGFYGRYPRINNGTRGGTSMVSPSDNDLQMAVET